jgi:predicted RNase H-like nuclease
MKTAGIDGCKAGWILITFDQGNEQYRILRNDDELKNAFLEFDQIFIDIPIGLNDDRYTRVCDKLLREKLGPEYASSVFSPPIRPALHAPTYVEANMQSFEFTEKKLSLQAWNITPKIKTVDRLLQESGELRDKVLESHPELIFMNLNGGMIYQKKNTKKGIKHRLELVSGHESIAADFFRDIKDEFRRNEVEENDIIDSMALAFAAKTSAEKRIKTLPENPETDSTGLKMAIHYI